MGVQGLKLCTITVCVCRCCIYMWQRPHIGPINSIVARLGIHAPTGVAYI